MPDGGGGVRIASSLRSSLDILAYFKKIRLRREKKRLAEDRVSTYRQLVSSLLEARA